MLTVDEASALITAGACLAIAGDEALLRQLPRGAWVGGTIPYFMGDEGGTFTVDTLYVDELPGQGEPRVESYGPDDLGRIPADAFDHGYSLTIIPAMTDTHQRFAKEGPEYEGMFLHPLIGWIAGVKLEDIGKVTPKTFHGPSGEVFEDRAVAIHLALPEDQTAIIDIINVFEQGDGDTLTFEETGFQAARVRVNGGEPEPFAAYMHSREIDTRLPLVANYMGTMINASVQSVPDDDLAAVALYAPVFEGVEYRFARPMEDYLETFSGAVPETASDVGFACNCILNYVYSGLEGKRTGTLTGPMTFGEIAYQLLNQTLVYLHIE